MIHHKQHGKKRTLALLLAGSVLFTNIPVSANAVSDIELSADESASDETANTGNTATNDAVDISIDSIDENTASSTVDDSSELQSAAPDDSTSSDDFSSDDDEAVFSSGSESPNSENIDRHSLHHYRTWMHLLRNRKLTVISALQAMHFIPELTMQMKRDLSLRLKIREIPASAGLSASHPTLRRLCLPGNRSTTIFPKNNWLISGQIE